MHCPNCRHENPSTTRFCNACGAVLVEDAPGVGRRRVLRPWGLRRSAPLTISPDIDAPQAPHPRRLDASVRLDLVLAAGVITAIIGATALFSRSMASDATPQDAAAAADEAVTVIVVPPLHTTSISAPALVESAIAPRPRSPTAQPRKPKEAVRPTSVPDVVSVAVEPVETPAVEAPAPPRPAAVVPVLRDRWEVLRDALSACKLQTNILDRAMCEQGARIEHCTQHWDLVELCPSGRPAITQ